MQRIRKHLPSPALVVAIVALVAALGGTSLAAGLGILNTKAKNKTVGVGPLTYVTGSVVSGPGDNVATATCPGGLEAIGGGVHRTSGNPIVRDSHMTPSGWSALVNLGATDAAQAVVACARSRVVTGSPPA
jgi:hypothetical protein